jgi:Ca-activated chloride channel family protein
LHDRSQDGIYELAPVGKEVPTPAVDPLKYQKPTESSAAAQRGDLLTVKLRYKRPEEDQSQLIEIPVTDGRKAYNEASEDYKFAAAVAAFGMLLRDSEHKGSSTFDSVLALASSGRGADEEGYRGEFIQLVKLAETLHKADEKKEEAEQGSTPQRKQEKQEEPKWEFTPKRGYQRSTD